VGSDGGYFYTIWGNKIEDMGKVEVGEFISER
jgi:hypothetical protein